VRPVGSTCFACCSGSMTGRDVGVLILDGHGWMNGSSVRSTSIVLAASHGLRKVEMEP
jgi:hypothetical protein